MPHRRNQSRKRGYGTRKRRARQRKLLAASATVYKNIDVREGVPQGLVHVPVMRTQPLARTLNIPFLPAVVAFREYKRGYWAADKHGIVIAHLDEPRLRHAIVERQAARVKADTKSPAAFAEAILRA